MNLKGFNKNILLSNNNLIQNVGKYTDKNGIKTTKKYIRNTNKPLYKNYISISLSSKGAQVVAMKLSQFLDDVDFCWMDASESWMCINNRWYVGTSFNNGGLSGNWAYMQYDSTNKEISCTKGSATDPIYALFALYYTKITD